MKKDNQTEWYSSIFLMGGGKIFHIFVDLSINEYFEISCVVLWLFTKTYSDGHVSEGFRKGFE